MRNHEYESEYQTVFSGSDMWELEPQVEKLIGSKLSTALAFILGGAFWVAACCAVHAYFGGAK